MMWVESHVLAESYLRESSHEGFIILHSTSSVDQNYIKLVLLGYADQLRSFGNTVCPSHERLDTGTGDQSVEW